MDEHQHQRVAGDGLLVGVLDVVAMCPRLDGDREWLHSPVQSRVATDQLRVAYANNIVNVQIHLDLAALVGELEYGYFGVYELHIVGVEEACGEPERVVEISEIDFEESLKVQKESFTHLDLADSE